MFLPKKLNFNMDTYKRMVSIFGAKLLQLRFLGPPLLTRHIILKINHQPEA